MRIIPPISKENTSISQTNNRLNKALLDQQIAEYKKFIVSNRYDEQYKWVALKNFQDKWDIDAQDFKSMYDNSLKSNDGDNLWANNHYFPKAVMLQFIEHDQERVRRMFKDLFDESIALEQRFNGFEGQCDLLLAELQPSNPSMKNHFHDGQRMISLYLAFQFPDKYSIYKYTEFKVFMTVLGNTDIPGTGEFERFFKAVRGINTYISKDIELLEMHRALLSEDCFKGGTLMLAQDFIFRTAKRFM